MRKEKNGTRYFSFNEVAQEVFNLPPVKEQITNVGKRNDMQAKFEKNNACKTCGKPMAYKGGNIVCCTNPECSKPSFRLLDDKGKSFARAIFGEGVKA